MFVPLHDICRKVLLLRCTHTCCAVLPEEDTKNVVCVWHCLLWRQECGSASWLEQTGPLSDHSCFCTVNVFPCSRGSQPGLIATEPSVIQECNYLLTQIIYLAGSPYPSHRAASTCQQMLLYPFSLFIFFFSSSPCVTQLISGKGHSHQKQLLFSKRYECFWNM